jgi:site-specific recombinase XerD
MTCPTCLAAPPRQNTGRIRLSRKKIQITYVSHLIEDGADPLFVQQQAGHSWASTTAVCTTVGQDARNRMLRSALDRAFREGEQQ